MSMSSNEKQDFSGRLQQALRNAQYPPDSPTRLAREFNLRFQGHPVTPHAARKWLTGEAIPTQEKLRTIAQWLGISAEWLRFGAGDPGIKLTDTTSTQSRQRLEPRDMAIIESLQRLDDKYRDIAHAMIRVLVHASEGK